MIKNDKYDLGNDHYCIVSNNLLDESKFELGKTIYADGSIG